MRKFLLLTTLLSSLALSGCATMMVTGAVVGAAATATKYAVKGTVGAGKLAYKGTKAVVKGTANLITGDEEEAEEFPDYEG